MHHINVKPFLERMARNGEKFEHRMFTRECNLNEYSKEELEEVDLLSKVGLAEIDGDRIKLYAPWSPHISSFFTD